MAVLDDGSRIGRSCRGNTLGLSLARAPSFPDPTADRGHHRFTYAVMPHDGCWRKAGVIEEAEHLGMPMRTMPVGAEAAGTLGTDWSMLRFESEGTNFEIAAIKPAENGAGAVVRLVERQGSCGTIRFKLPPGVDRAREVDLREMPIDRGGFQARNGEVALEFTPFQIRSILLD